MSTARLARVAVKIPARIERGPTDILRALASTVKFIPQQPFHDFQEDPYLLPRRPGDSRLFLMSKLSGRKTAKFLLNKHPEMFFRDEAEPKVEAFLPSEEFRMDMELDEADLRWCIENNDVENACIAYKSLKDKGITISDPLLLDLLEFFCFTNEEVLLDSDSQEYEKMVADYSNMLVKTTWNRDGIAVKLFNDVKDRLDPPRAYSAMIMGLSMANEHAACYELFLNFKQSHPNQGLYPDAYGYLLYTGTTINSSMETVYKYIDEITTHMEAHLVKPSLKVFNGILNAYRSYNTDHETIKTACKLFKDMETLGVKPSLSTYNYFFRIISRTGRSSPYRNLIFDGLTHIEMNSDLFTVRDSEDLQFFPEVMNIFASREANLTVSNRLYKLFTKNSTFITGQRSKNKVLNEYFKLMLTTDSIDKILKFYDDHVPVQMRPNADTYDLLVEALEMYQVDEEVVSRIGRDVIQFNMAKIMKSDEIFRKDPAYIEMLEQELIKFNRQR